MFPQINFFAQDVMFVLKQLTAKGGHDCPLFDKLL
jgi:hypothetical protein